MTRNPMPTVTFQGNIYALKSRSIAVPDFAVMDTIGALLWLTQNTTRRGYQKPQLMIAASVNA